MSQSHADDETRRRAERARRVALFRCELIQDVIDPAVSSRQRGRLVRALAEGAHQGPFGEQVRVSRQTIDRWVRWWRAGGFEALLPTPARVTPRTPAEVLALAAALKRERPERTAAQVARILRAQSGWAPSERTLQRHFVRLELDRTVPASPPVFGRFEADRPNELWTGDALHGPVICGRKTFLFCFIDDRSRAVMGARFGYHEDTVRLAAALRPALASRGIPEQVYVDNGSPFVDSWLLRACAVLGIKLVHSTPARPQGRGKIERFFRTVRQQFLVELAGEAAERVGDLAELNRLLVAWVETDYHPQVHSETGAPPLRRWREGLPDPLPHPTPAQLREAFLWAEHRMVTTSATVSLHNNTYQVDPLLVGRKVELVFDPFDLTDIEVRHQQRTFGKAVAFRIGRHAHPKARPEQPDTGPPPPTGVDYLRLLDAAHQHQLATRINYAALADVDADGHRHPQPVGTTAPNQATRTPTTTASSPASSPVPTRSYQHHDRASPSHLRVHAHAVRARPRPQMLHRHTAHAEATARITRCIDQHALGVVTGEVGVGKTVAVRAALAALDPARHTLIYLPNPTVGTRGIHHAIVAALGGTPRPHRATLIPQATDALATEAAERGRTPVLVIDEGHLLDHDQLEGIRMLTNHDLDSRCPLACLLVGQPTLRRKIKLGVLAALDQRIAVRYHMPGMTLEETTDYLRHHLALAGRSDTLFSDDAAALLHQTSRGYPRAVNNLAVQALLAAFATNKSIVDESSARAAVTEVTTE